MVSPRTMSPREAVAESSGFSFALQFFREKLSPDDVCQFRKITTLADLGLAIKDIESEQAKKRSLRSIGKIRPFLKILEEYSKVIEVFVNAKPDVLAFIWGPIKLCLQVASKHQKAFDALLSAYSEIGDSIPIISAIDEIFISQSHVRLVLADVYKDILTFHERAISFFKKRGWQIAILTTCRTFEDLFGDVIKNLERSKRLLLTSANIAHFHDAQNARASIQENFKRHQRTLEEQRKFTVRDWLAPVNVMNQHHDLQRRRELVPQTTKWIFSDVVWKEWLLSYQARSHLFWLSGIPGAGKTVLFSAIVDEIPKHIINPEESIVIFFYCKYNDPERNTYESIAKSLIAQLLNDNPNCLSYLYDQAMKSCECYAKTKKDYQILLKSMIQCYSLVYVGIDGLDECDLSERKDVLLLMHSLLESSGEVDKVRVFLASRAEKDIEQSLRLSRHLELRPHHLQNDIISFVEVEADMLNEKVRFDSEQLERIVAAVATQAAGMFLLARLIMDNLKDQDTRDDIEEELRSDILPQGIDQAYGRILLRIQKLTSPRNRTRAKQVLELLTCSKRTLHLHEIQGALSIRLEDKSMEFEKRKYLSHFKDLCGPIVEVRSDETIELVHATAKKFLEENHSGYIMSSTAEYNMADLCLKYLTFDCFRQNLSDQEIIHAVREGKYAFQDYSFCYWLAHVQSLHARSVKLGHEHPLLEQCLEFATSISPAIATSIEDLKSQNLITTNDAYVSKLLSTIQNSYDKASSSPGSFQEDGSPPEHYLPLFRIRRFIEAAVECQAGEDYLQTLRDAYGITPFKCSVLDCLRFHQGFSTRKKRDIHLKTHTRPFKCTQDNCDYQILGFSSPSLLTTHIDLAHTSSPLPHRFANVKPRSVWKALEDAIDKNEPSIVRDLCSEVINLPKKQKGLLLRAVNKGSMEAAKVLVELLDCEQELKEKNSRQNPLYLALAQGQVDLSRIILPKVHASLFLDLLFLEGAINSGNPEVVKISVHHCFDYFNSSNVYRYLKVAIYAGYIEIVALLLEELGKLHLDGKHFVRALEVAAERDFEVMVRRMLKIAQRLKIRIPSQGQAFERKMGSGDIDTAVVDVMARKRVLPRYSLQEAARSGNIIKVKTLLRGGAVIDKSTSPYGTALQAATVGGHEEMVRFLINKGAYVNIEGENTKSSLAEAAHNGNTALILLLLQAGADISGRCQFSIDMLSLWSGFKFLCQSWTPLHFAAYGKHKEAVQILLERGANINAMTSQGDSTLYLAIYANYSNDAGNKKWIINNYTIRVMPVLRLLVSSGANVNSKNKDDDTPLHLLMDMLRYRAGEWSKDDHPFLLGIIQAAHFLLKNGADFQAKGYNGWTPRESAAAAGHDPDGNSILDLILQYKSSPD